MAVLFAVLAVLIYIAGLMCSHLSAFRVATNLRLTMTRTYRYPAAGCHRGVRQRQTAPHHLRRPPVLRKRIWRISCPDKAKVMATIMGLLALLAIFDWRLGLLSLAPVAAGLCRRCRSMTGKSMQEKMTQYQNALADMSSEAVEYVRGIPVVKTFGQTVFSFKKFKAAIDNYERWTIAYTKEMRVPMCLYTLAINSVFVFLILGGFWLSRGTVDAGADAEPAVLCHHHACGVCGAEQADVHERKQHAGAGRAHPH